MNTPPALALWVAAKVRPRGKRVVEATPPWTWGDPPPFHQAAARTCRMHDCDTRPLIPSIEPRAQREWDCCVVSSPTKIGRALISGSTELMSIGWRTMQTICPLCSSTARVRVDEVAWETLVAAYATPSLGVPVAHLLAGDTDSITLWECADCGLRWYDPPVAGDAAFYEALQRHDWYYQADKAEFAFAAAHVPGGSRVLEVGCRLVRTSAPFWLFIPRARIQRQGCRSSPGSRARRGRVRGAGRSSSQPWRLRRRVPLSGLGACAGRAWLHDCLRGRLAAGWGVDRRSAIRRFVCRHCRIWLVEHAAAPLDPLARPRAAPGSATVRSGVGRNLARARCPGAPGLVPQHPCPTGAFRKPGHKAPPCCAPRAARVGTSRGPTRSAGAGTLSSRRSGLFICWTRAYSLCCLHAGTRMIEQHHPVPAICRHVGALLSCAAVRRCGQTGHEMAVSK